MSASSSSGNVDDDEAPELPGFYYDPVKKKYFRVLPGHNNHNPLTSDSIRKAKCVKKGHRKSSGEHSSNKRSSRSHSIFHRTKRTSKLQQQLRPPDCVNKGLNRILQERNRGSLSSSQFAYQSIFSSIHSALRSSNVKKVESEHSESGALCRDVISRMLPSQNGTKLICLRKDSTLDKSYFCHVSKAKEPLSAGGRLRQRVLGRARSMTVEDMCYYYWSVNSSSAGEDTPGGHTGLLCTAILGLGNTCVLFHPNVESAAVGGVVITKVIRSNRNAPARKCAFNGNPLSNVAFSVSVGKKVLAVHNPDAYFNDVADDAPSADTFQLPEPSFSQHFSTTAPMLFNGLRNSQVVGTDLRTLGDGSNCQSVVLTDKKVCQRNTPTCVRTLRNGRSVVVYYKGCKNTTCMWDLRNTTAPVLTYFTMENNFVMNRCQDFFLDDAESFLTCVTQEGFLKIFDVNNGHCVQSMPCFTNDDQTINAAHYNNSWAMFNHTPGVFGIMRNNFAWIPLMQ